MACWNDLRQQILTHFELLYHLHGHVAHELYQEVINLYHRVLTITDMSKLKDDDGRILSALRVAITYNYDFNDAPLSRY